MTKGNEKLLQLTTIYCSNAYSEPGTVTVPVLLPTITNKISDDYD